MKQIMLSSVALLALTTPSWAYSGGGGPMSKPSVTLCTGPAGGNYERAAVEVVVQARDRLDVHLIETRGSVDNLDKLAAGECDAAPVQADALKVYKARYAKDYGKLERMGPLYREYVHLVCNKKAGVSRVTELRSGKHVVAIGPSGSGSAVTWDGFGLADKGYLKAPTVPLAGPRALEKVKDGTEVQCMVFTAALNSPFVSGAVNDASDYVKLVEANDGDFDTSKDEKGQPLYAYVDIPSGTYSKLQSAFFGSSVATVAVEAVWVVRAAWIDANEKPYDWLIAAKNKATPAIKKLVNQ